MIKIADTNDLERICELFKELHSFHVGIDPKKFRMPDDVFFRKVITDYLNSDEWITLVREDSGSIDGYAVFKAFDVDSPDENPRRVCYVHHFMISESSRRKGAGTEFFTGIQEMAHKINCDCIRFGVNAANAGAIAFYEKMGMSPTTITMEKRLNNGTL